MRSLLLVITTFLLTIQQNYAQSPAWQWGKSDVGATIPLNPDYIKHVVATGNNKTLWGALQNNKTVASAIMGDYKLTEYNAAGVAGASATITGKVTLIDAKADATGNWYIMGQLYDTVNFPGGTTLIKSSVSGSEFFLFRLNSGTLSLAWVKLLGSDNTNTATVFTLRDNAIYMAIDSEYTKVCKYDIATGSETLLFTQPFSSHTSSIAVDAHNNIYLAGSCAFTGMNFNGHVVTSSSAYPAYLVRYRADGTYDWHYAMHDVTCVDRKVTIDNDNIVYYTGNINDTLRIGGHLFHHPAWLYDFLVCRFDSTGTLQWTYQLKDSLQGDAYIDYNDHATVLSDNSLCVLANIRMRTDWGNGVITNVGTHQDAAVVNFNNTGLVNWVKYVGGSYTTGEHVVTDGGNVWVTGNVMDSTAYTIDGTTVPVAFLSSTPYMAKLNTGLPPMQVKEIATATVDVTVAPNPATDHINVLVKNTTGPVQLRLTDITGRVVCEITSNKPTIQIETAPYTRGLYLLEIIDGSARTVQKIALY